MASASDCEHSWARKPEEAEPGSQCPGGRETAWRGGRRAGGPSGDQGAQQPTPGRACGPEGETHLKPGSLPGGAGLPGSAPDLAGSRPALWESSPRGGTPIEPVQETASGPHGGQAAALSPMRQWVWEKPWRERRGPRSPTLSRRPSVALLRASGGALPAAGEALAPGIGINARPVL